jgi:uncharacterized membrane-anchored protein YitT (DUF2179 family)
MKAAKKVFTYVVIALIAFTGAMIYEIFIFPNNFAPSGINGVCTIIQHMFGISVGYLSLLINIPLAIFVYLKVSKPLAIRSMVYVAVFSIALLILDHVDLSRFAYATENGTSAILGPLVGGISFGYCYGQLLNCSAYSGGTDFIAALIHKKRPDQSVLGLIFTLNAIVAVSSYFVYDYKIEPVILSILYSFASTTVSRQMQQSDRSAVRFEIITDYPQEISDAIITRLNHSATLIPGKGMYHGRETSILICIVNKTQTAALSAIIREYPNTFAVMSSVNEVMGNFKHMTTDGKIEPQYLDHGDGSAV